jgi:hypothetical protein
LAIEAKLANDRQTTRDAKEDDLDELRAMAATFPERCNEKIDAWKNRLRTARERGPTVLWGSGSKAVAFLSAVDTSGIIENVVDINPYRQGHYMPGTAQPIVTPAALESIRPATVVVMNAVYCDEIRRSLSDLRLAPEVLAL